MDRKAIAQSERSGLARRTHRTDRRRRPERKGVESTGRKSDINNIDNRIIAY